MWLDIYIKIITKIIIKIIINLLKFNNFGLYILYFFIPKKNTSFEYYFEELFTIG